MLYEVLSACEELKRPSSWCIRTLIDISSFLRVRFQVWGVLYVEIFAEGMGGGGMIYLGDM